MTIGADTKGAVREAVQDHAFKALDNWRSARVAEKKGNEDWVVQSMAEERPYCFLFGLHDNRLDGRSCPAPGSIRLKPSFFVGAKTISKRRVFAPCRQRRCAAAPMWRLSSVLMPSYVNIGAYVDEGSMIDTWATVGSCAQIGKHCHISGGVGIGGVLEPLQAAPVIIEDNCFIGARSEVAEGVIVREGAVLSMGVFLGASTKIIDRASGEVLYGEVPPYAVVVPGSLPSDKGGPNLYCAVIVKQVDEKTRSKTSVNELLRD